jgi:hypothetical protein
MLIAGDPFEEQFVPYCLHKRLVEATELHEGAIGEPTLVLEKHKRQMQRPIQAYPATISASCLCPERGIRWGSCDSRGRHGRRCTPRPYQDLSVLVHCEALGDNEFCLEVFEVGVIETELALQSAIGDTATVAEQRHNLIDNLVKVHASPFSCISPQGMSQCGGSAYQNRNLIAIATGMHYPTVLGWSTKSRSGDTACSSASSFSIVGREVPRSYRA